MFDGSGGPPERRRHEKMREVFRMCVEARPCKAEETLRVVHLFYDGDNSKLINVEM